MSAPTKHDLRAIRNAAMAAGEAKAAYEAQQRRAEDPELSAEQELEERATLEILRQGWVTAQAHLDELYTPPPDEPPPEAPPPPPAHTEGRTPHRVRGSGRTPGMQRIGDIIDHKDRAAGERE